MSTETKTNNNFFAGAGAIAGKEIYEGKVALEALNRVGPNPNIKGIIHEVLVKDMFNLKNAFSGKTAVLTSSTNAVRDDILIREGGKIVGRMQLKDTAASIMDTIGKVADGKYSGTLLMGTKETSAAYAKTVADKVGRGINITQKMTSTGVSSADTARIGAKALGEMPATGALMAGARNAGMFGGAISGGIEALTSLGDLSDGRISGGEYLGRVAKETVGGGLAAGAATVASSAAAAGTAAAISASGAGAVLGGTALGAVAVAAAPVTASLAVAVGVGYIAKSIFDGIFS